MYINDLPNCITQPMILFADDSTALFTRSAFNYEDEINTSLSNIINWLNVNKLKINLDKTCYMRFKTKNTKFEPLYIHFNNKPLTEVTSTRFLGLNIDSNMSWKTHVNYVCSRVNQFSYALYMLRKVANIQVLLSAYHAYVGSMLRYGLLYWGCSADRETAFKAQKKCIRAMSGLNPTDSCRPHFESFKILTLPSLFIYDVSIFVRNNIGEYENLKSVSHNTRLCNPKSHTAVYVNSIFGVGVKM